MKRCSFIRSPHGMLLALPELPAVVNQWLGLQNRVITRKGGARRYYRRQLTMMELRLGFRKR